MAIKCYHCKGNHELVSQVKDCAKIPAAFAAKVETGKIVQTVIAETVKKVTVPAHRTDAKYLALKAQIPFNPAGAAETAKVVVAAASIAAGNAAAKIVHESLSEIQAAVKVQVLETKTGQELEPGMYQLVTQTGVVTVYKVKFNKTGTFKFAEKLEITAPYYDGEKPKGKFWYAPGLINKLTSADKMGEAEAKAFHDATKLKYGQDYGFCCVCGKLLTVKKSIDAGIGPVCVTKM